MRKRAFTTLAAGAVLVSSGLSAGGAAAQNAVDTFSNFAWRGMTTAACTIRAANSVRAALGPFGVAAPGLDTNTFRVLARTDDTNIFVYCFGDDDTPALDGAAANRVLVAIYVSTSRGTVGGQIRDFLAVCMEAGACPAGTPAPPRKP